MNDFVHLEKTIVRELSCRLCLCTDVVKLKPLSAELKRKIKRLFDISIRADDNLPKAICHDCLQQVATMHLYSIKVEKTQKFLDFHKSKSQDEKKESEMKLHPLIANLYETENSQPEPAKKKQDTPISPQSPPEQQGDVKSVKSKIQKRNKTDLKFLESMPIEEFAKTEGVNKNLLSGSSIATIKSKQPLATKTTEKRKEQIKPIADLSDSLDRIVLIDGRPAKQGAALDRQITLFYKMECCICHETNFHFRSLMRHYKERHGVPGYVSCCNKKFHYFYPKKIIEHMAYHLQSDIFMCPSCHQNFQTSQDLIEHQSNGGRSEGKILCPRCSQKFPTYKELGAHIVVHRSDKKSCDYCGKLLKHYHRKKTINNMEDVILCSQCVRMLKTIEKQEKELKEKMKSKHVDSGTLQKYQKFHQAMGLSGDEDASTD